MVRWIINKIGEDWVFLCMLGVIMAVLSFTMDFCIAELLKGDPFSPEPLLENSQGIPCGSA